MSSTAREASEAPNIPLNPPSKGDFCQLSLDNKMHKLCIDGSNADEGAKGDSRRIRSARPAIWVLSSALRSEAGTGIIGTLHHTKTRL
jgi:hypothetical protein